MGRAGDIPLVGDFDGDGYEDLIVYSPTFLSFTIYTGPPSGKWYTFALGRAGDIPIVADITGDRAADLVLFRPSDGTWNVYPSSSLRGLNLGKRIEMPWSFQWGKSTDKYVFLKDFDGDGTGDLVIYRPETRMWHVCPIDYINHNVFIRDGNPTYKPWTFDYGASWLIPIPGYWDSDNMADLGVLHKDTMTSYFVPRAYILGDASGDHGTRNFQYGSVALGDQPCPADFDGDSTTDICIWRPGTGMMYVVPTKYALGRGGSPFSVQIGGSGMVPKPLRFWSKSNAVAAVWNPALGNWYVADGQREPPNKDTTTPPTTPTSNEPKKYKVHVETQVSTPEHCSSTQLVVAKGASISCLNNGACEDSVPENTVVTLEIAYYSSLVKKGLELDNLWSGYRFDGWEGDCKNQGTEVSVPITVKKEVNCTAKFSCFRTM